MTTNRIGRRGARRCAEVEEATRLVIECGLTRYAAAKKMGVHPSSISKNPKYIDWAKNRTDEP